MSTVGGQASCQHGCERQRVPMPRRGRRATPTEEAQFWQVLYYGGVVGMVVGAVLTIAGLLQWIQVAVQRPTDTSS